MRDLTSAGLTGRTGSRSELTSTRRPSTSGSATGEPIVVSVRRIDWKPIEDKSGMGLLGGFAQINELGTHVLKSSVASPIRITFDERRAVVGDPQEIKMPGAEAQALKDAFEQVILAIEQIAVSEGDKKEAQSLLLKLLQSKAGADALGEGGAQSLITKYFGSF